MPSKTEPGKKGEPSRHFLCFWKLEESNSRYEVWKLLAERSSTAGWKAGLVSRELEYVAEAISKQSVEEAAGFSTLLIVKLERKVLTSGRKREAKRNQHYDRQGPWPVQAAKDAGIRSLQRACSPSDNTPGRQLQLIPFRVCTLHLKVFLKSNTSS